MCTLLKLRDSAMKCALVIPAWAPEDIFSSKTAASQINYWQPLGTLYVAAVLIRAGHEVCFLNGAFLAHEVICTSLRVSPGFIGIYSTTFGWDRAKKAAKDFKIMFGRWVFICAGGPFPIAMQEKCLSDAGASMDAIVTGEGEYSALEIIGRLEKGRGLEGVEGVVYRDGDRIIKNPPRPLISDLDGIPFPARQLLGDAGLYIPPPATYRRKPVAVMMTSRGCNRNCIYCFQIDKTRGDRYTLPQH